MAKGAAWTVAMRFSLRGIGLVSTVILARLLVPADFGLVAMATIIFGLIEVMGEFGFGVFLIQKQNAGHDYYDPAWTLKILRGVVTCGLLFVIAMPVADFFGEPRLVEIFYVLALVALVRSIGNIGVIDFQKYLTFGKDFKLHVVSKLAAFCVTITAAILLRNYWALVIGIATAGFVGVALSYMMHPYRPRLSLARWREIMHFSKWLLVNNILVFLNRQSDGLIVGKVLGTASLGFYSIAYEITALATSEVVLPIRRALLPGYAKLAHDSDALRKSYIDGLALILLLAAPAAAGIGLVADPLVRLFLGDKWLDAIPLLRLFAIFAVIQVSFVNSGPLFLALGRPHLNTVVTGVNIAVGIPLLIWATFQWGMSGTIWALIVSSFVAVIVSFSLVVRALRLSISKLFMPIWRTVVSLGTMVIMVQTLSIYWPQFVTTRAPELQLAANILVGVISYVGMHLLLWYASGRPDGSELIISKFVKNRISNLRL